MGFLTKYGSYWGTVPPTTGNIYFVAPGAGSYTLAGPQGIRTYPASDNNDGLSPERALATINRAWDLVTANAGDVIVLLAGTHSASAGTITCDVAGVTMLGVGHRFDGVSELTSPKTVIQGATSGGGGLNDDLINVTASDTEIGYLELRPTQGFDAICFETESALDGLYFHHLKLEMTIPDATTKTRGINFGHRAARSGSDYGLMGSIATATLWATIEDLYAISDGAMGPAIEFATCYAIVRRAKFDLTTSATWASPVRVATRVRNSTMQDCVWVSAGIMGQCIDGTDSDAGPLQASGMTLVDCTFTGNLTAVNKPVDGFTLSGTSSLFSQIAYGRGVQVATATAGSTVGLVT